MTIRRNTPPCQCLLLCSYCCLSILSLQMYATEIESETARHEVSVLKSCSACPKAIQLPGYINSFWFHHISGWRFPPSEIKPMWNNTIASSIHAQISAEPLKESNNNANLITWTRHWPNGMMHVLKFGQLVF